MGTSAVLWSIGAARELIPAGSEVVILSLDVVVPNVNTDVNGRRHPIVEFGVGYRFRTWKAIAPLPWSRVSR